MKKKRTPPRKRRAPSRKASSAPPPGTTIIVQPQHPTETPPPVVHLGAANLTVSQPALLAPALQQHEKQVVIENDQIAPDFIRLLRWKEREKTNRIAFVATLIALVLSMAIANKYHLEFRWYLKWKVEEIGGKITLTPSSGVKQRGTHPQDGD
jgi:hypothetical protein